MSDASHGAVAEVDVLAALAPFTPRPEMTLYHQVADALRTFIERSLPEGGELPTEDALVRHYEVSRITIRHALRILELEGLIRKRRAKSAEVLPAQQRRHRPWQVNSLDDIVALSSRGALQFISYEAELSEVAAQALGLPRSAPLFCLTNLLRIDRRPFAYNKIYFPQEIGSALQQSDFSDVTIYRNIENKLAITICDVEASARSTLASDEVAKALLCRRGEPILVLTLLFQDAGQKPIQFSVNHYRGDEFVLSYRFRKAPNQIG